MSNGRVSIVTGACGGIGAAIVERLASCGINVVASDLQSFDDARDLMLRSGAHSGHGEIIYCRADVRDRAQVAEVMNTALHRFGRLDICVGNAGIVTPAPFVEINEDDWLSQMDVNLGGCFRIGQEAARAMVRSGTAGRIIFTGSWVQDIPSQNIAAYCTSKAGLKMLARCMALELAAHQITVNLVAPGFVDAGLSARLVREDPLLEERCRQITPLGRAMSAGQVAEAVLFLCSTGADYMTGSTLLIDGGNSLCRRS